MEDNPFSMSSDMTKIFLAISHCHIFSLKGLNIFFVFYISNYDLIE